ncbi:MAG: glutamate synthase large subunit [Candidatus Omnitrophica bacterium]|nr:glutamate synthase large subunit [Candidatus Omnitrophota bacterium]
MSSSFYPNKQGLYDPQTEHDSCGVGFVAHIKGKRSHKIIRDGIQILENLTHRGATGSDPKTGDGAGMIIQIPDKFFRKECAKLNIVLPKEGEYGAGLVFLPADLESRNIIEQWAEKIVHEEGQKFLGWRNVPYEAKEVGEVAKSVQPYFKQIFIGRGADTAKEKFELKLYIIRKRLQNKVAESTIGSKKYFYICSLSSKTFVYKGQLMAEQVDRFFKDLADDDMESAVALVHSRYSTNTFPTWALAHPFRFIAHNGEINTLRGNINWMKAREKNFISDILGDDIKKIWPVIEPGGSDSSSFDNAFELLVMAGRSLPHAVMMMIPEAWSGHGSMEAEKKDFYEYHSCLMEPWDGPASIAFTDGRYVGAVLDRNGLRPSRLLKTKDDIVVMASETGVLDIDPANIELKSRLQPGKMFLIDTVEGRIIDDKELKHKFAANKPYGEWLKNNVVDLEALPEPAHYHKYDLKTLLERQRAFGYTLEDLKVVLQPMVVGGMEATGSMGADTPLAVLSQTPQPLYHYFKQLFAQVTNPPIDPIREEVVMAEDVMLGAEQNLLTETEIHCQRLRLKRPILKNIELEKIRGVKAQGLKAVTMSMLFNKNEGVSGMEQTLSNLFTQADTAVSDGVTILILSDRDINCEKVPVPALLACSALHHHLIRQGTRTKVSIVLETGEARELHHFAVLIGYGANAINPYLIFETIKDEIEKGILPSDLTYDTACKNFLKSTRKGLLKIISKMGISTIQSYCGAQIFEAVGLNEGFIQKYFTATPSRIGGIGIAEVAKEALLRHEHGYPVKERPSVNFLEEGGFYQWRKNGEYHQINPVTISMLQYAVRMKDQNSYDQFAKNLNELENNCSSIRGLIQFKKGNAIPLSEVEPAAEIVKRFATGAMSYGSISREAHECMATAMNRMKAFSNTGEGGEDPARFKPLPNGDILRSRIKQVAQGRFGVTIEYLVNSDQMQIKMAQGAKPGEGGQLPGHKVSKEIAKTRHTTPGVGLISPPPHHDIYSIEDLAQLIHDLKNANPDADVSVKLVAEIGVGTVAAGVSKGKSDHLLISGFEGGTGASPQTSIKFAGLPMELGIAEAQQVLVMNDLRGRIRVQADGQLRTGRDVAIAAMLGADEFGFATIALVSLGCMMLRKCHLNACSVGIATQDPELRKKFAGKPEHLINYFTFVAEEARKIMAELGFRKFEDMVGRVDMLEMRDVIAHWKAKGVDLSNVLHKPDVPQWVAIHHVGKQTHGLEKALDNVLIEKTKDAVENKNKISLEFPIKNINRTVGTMLSSKIAKKYGLTGLPENTINIKFTGSAGQSFGAFLANGVTLTLEGDANDYVGKGLSGGRIVVYPSKNATFVPEENILVGNVLLYGAILGEAFFRGLAGERFAVRNSGAHAVVEGIGDHGCEYMTGGRVVVIGSTGRNFAAGMSGGIAYVWDKNNDFKSKCNMEMVELFKVENKVDVEELKLLLEKHAQYTGSTVAQGILKNWAIELPKFVKVYPIDYRKVVESMVKAAETSDRTLTEDQVAKERN